ncbi:MAG: hypothetical protein HQ592_12985 [Planctomycetes bacterium]|nr:hypothetical protein [Planctomycetota bacterium]
MSTSKLEVVDVGSNCYTVNAANRTVALISSQGYIDWLLKSPMQDGPLHKSIRKETHFCYVLGFKLLLTTPTPETLLKKFSYRLEDDGARLVLTGHCESKDGKFLSDTAATLRTDEQATRYEWDMDTTITCVADTPQEVKFLEYNNVYPSECGRCMLFAPSKKYDCTLITDRDGTVWKFPHQHLLHYGRKLTQLEFAEGSVAGFFGEDTGSPVAVVNESSIAPDWGICDMYYDLHCCGRPERPMNPGEQWNFKYLIKYLGRAESEKYLAAAKPVPVTAEDWEKHDYPRLDLGMNSFNRRVNIDRLDDASGFRPRPPTKVWDKETGHSAKGSLLITNEKAKETVWIAEPPTQIPKETKLNITGMFKTENVTGKGAFIRVRYHTYVWHPGPHIEWPATLESIPVTGTTPGWVKVTVPELHVPEEHFDYLVCIDVVLDGKGKAWLTDVDIDLQPAPSEQPILEEGSSRAKSVASGAGGAASGSAM